MRMVMNLCSVLILPSPDVSFGCSLEGQRGLCVILTKIHKSHSLFKWTSTTVDLERHVECLRAYFSHFPVFPQYSSLQVWQSVYVFLCLNEHVFVGSCQDICSLLHLSVVCGTGGELEWLLWVVIWKTIYACGSIGSRAIMQPFSLFLSLSFFVSLSFWLSLFDGSFFFFLFLFLCPSVPNND